MVWCCVEQYKEGALVLKFLSQVHWQAKSSAAEDPMENERVLPQHTGAQVLARLELVML